MPTAGPDAVHTARRALHELGAKARLQLLEEVAAELLATTEEGIEYRYGSAAEYRRIVTRKPWDEPIREWIRGFTAADVFYDIGANIGGFALLAGKLHSGRVPVVAFEPGAETFAAFTRNIFLNRLEHAITPLQIALSDQTGLQAFHYHRLGAGQALHALGAAVDYRRRRFTPVAVQTVAAFALDDLLDRLTLPRPTRIKLDVDGIEPRIVAGAAKTLSAGPCELWVEMTELTDEDPAPAALAQQLGALGFELLRRVEHDARESGYPRIYDALFVRR